MSRWSKAALLFTAIHAALIAVSIAAFRLVVNHPRPAWADPETWAWSYRVGMAWTGPMYIVTGFVAALAAWVALVGTRRGLASAAVVVGLAMGVELAGVRFGVPFGDYGYGTTLGPRLFGLVPIVIPLSWFLMLYASLAVAARWDVGPAGTVAGAALGLVAWDVLMDPAMSAAFPFWSWHQGGEYYGMPLVNWVGWFATGILLAAAAQAMVGDRLRELARGRLPLVLYALNGLFPLALALESGMYGAAVIGGAAMLAFGLSPMLRGLVHRRSAALAAAPARAP